MRKRPSSPRLATGSYPLVVSTSSQFAMSVFIAHLGVWDRFNTII